ncbi:hypothetical protein ABZ424_19775 [Streptomyces sp. NPDC005790]|uniref:hypothetical protein n=1 Tax=Streptomyces sp. NPDC005790 TaxID=3154777 RepID=UPI0033DFEC82
MELVVPPVKRNGVLASQSLQAQTTRARYLLIDHLTMTKKAVAAHIRSLLRNDLRVHAFAHACPWLKPNFAIKDVAVPLLPTSPSDVGPSGVITRQIVHCRSG